jgi:chitosanase
MIEELNIKRIKNVLCIAEMGTQTIPYEKVEVMNDGPGERAQVTLSIGFTQFGGNLGKVIEEYRKRTGVYARELSNWSMDSSSTAASGVFREQLKKAGLEDPIMGQVQEDLFISLYLGPAFEWAEKEGFTKPLSYLVVADSYLHSGSMLDFLRQRFTERTPKNGGREEVWISSYVKVRQEWLANHKIKLLRNTIYRTKYYNQLIANEDWELEEYHTIAMHGTKPLAVT